MQLVERFWTAVTYVVSLVTFSGVKVPVNDVQSPLLQPSKVIAPVTVTALQPTAGPTFFPPTGSRADQISLDFRCEYPTLVDYEECSSSSNRTCWLRKKEGARTDDGLPKQYDIWTNYERLYPKGILREYEYGIVDGRLNADGEWFEQAKLFNGEYPGPWLQACWGDTVRVTIHNKLNYNGTSVHWHGIRQNQTMHMDGVNGVTQCPIAPRDTFVYEWKVIQYGSSWFHSHYSAQYADGVVAPMTLHGPSTAPFDEAKYPILMTDWGHNSAFNAIHTELKHPSILLNGKGNVTRYDNSVPATASIPDPEEYYFDPPKDSNGTPRRFLLRLINTAFDSTFVFSIDHHVLQVVGADFVPIHPYTNQSVLVGIGQRYHVIVTADPQPNEDGVPPPDDRNFWIRTWKADCFRFDQSQASKGYEQTGILRYNSSSRSEPKSVQWRQEGVPLRCSDEPYKKLRPILEWNVQPAANTPKRDGNLTQLEKFDIQFDFTNGQWRFPLARFSMAGENFDPLQISYANPTFLHLNYTGAWNPLWAVFDENNYKETDWIWLVLRGHQGSTGGAHPIHLHGHDFAILEQAENKRFPETPDDIKNLDLKLDNPPRRDVVLLPTNGYVIIAFKADNPGAWLVHCHIAKHASWGLGMIIMERQKDADRIWPIFPDDQRDSAISYTIEGCNKWNKWWGDCCNWWTLPGDDPCKNCHLGQNGFADDSGI